MARRNSHNATRRRRGRFGPLFKLLCLVAVLVALTAGATVFFRVETVVVSGNQRYTQEEIIAASGIETGDNLYGLNKLRIDENIRTTLPYVGDLTIRRSLPSTIIITVTEWDAVARVAVPSQTERDEALAELAGEADGSSAAPAPAEVAVADQLWLINVKGKLLEPAPADSSALLVSGLVPLDPQAGEVLEVPPSQQTRLSALTALLAALNEAGLRSEVTSLRLGDTQLTLRYLERFDVKMELNGDFAYDLQFMQAVREQIEGQQGPEVKGTIDLTQEQYGGAVYSPA